MNKRIGSDLSNQIRRNEMRDMQLRRVKDEQNDDRLKDFIKIKEMKQTMREDRDKEILNKFSPKSDAMLREAHQLKQSIQA
jgi:hypothetical protein